MEFQQAIVLTIVFAAAGYVGRAIVLKARSMAPRSRCDSNCGCSAGSQDSQTASVE